MRQRFRRKPDQAVSAVRLALAFDTLTYQKWGGSQCARPGDWLVDNEGDVYTVAADTFARTYQSVGPGRWIKATPVWAQQATRSGSVVTQEGRTQYQAGDWLVSNGEDGSDAYAVGAGKFEQMYEPAPADLQADDGSAQ